MSGTTLSGIVARKHAEAAQLQRRARALWAAVEAMAPVRRFAGVLHGGAVIAEIKRRSPSGGTLRPDLDPARLAGALGSAGAAALSVLTDDCDFGGTLDDLAAARATVSLPVLRKDFTVDALQVAEARAAGADAVLLIVALLGGDGLRDCLAAADCCRMDAVVEVHDEQELSQALDAGATLVGINNRDLLTLTTDLATFGRLRPLLPEGVVAVAESGVASAAQAADLVRQGADAVLIGEALMRAADPAVACRAMVEACRAAAAAR